MDSINSGKKAAATSYIAFVSVKMMLRYAVLVGKADGDIAQIAQIPSQLLQRIFIESEVVLWQIQLKNLTM